MNGDRRATESPEHGKAQRLLVAVTPGQISEQLVEWAHRFAAKLHCPWAVVYVEGDAELTEEEQAQVTRTLALARGAGAEVMTESDPDFVRGLLRTALQLNATQIIVAKPVASPYYRRLLKKDQWLERLLRESGEIDIHVVRLKEESAGKRSSLRPLPQGSTFGEYLAASGIILAVAWALTFARSAVSYHAVAFIFLAVVVIMASYVGRGATLLAAVLSAALWDYLFEEPIYSFHIQRLQDQILFLMYLVIAIGLGQITAQIRKQERAVRELQERAEALRLLTREVTEAVDFNDMLMRAVRHLTATFKAPVALFLSWPGPGLATHPAGTLRTGDDDAAIAKWVYTQGKPAGKFTANFPSAGVTFLPLIAYGGKFGVVGLRLSQALPPSVHQRNLMDAFSEQVALAIHRYEMQQLSENSKVLAESERLSKTLLNSISHEFRTPLAVIQSATAHIVSQEKQMSESQRAMTGEIQEATDRLNRLVGKVLEIARLESGHIKPKLEPCEVTDLILTALHETRKELARHRVSVEIAPDLPVVAMDFPLMLQSLTNLLSNAAYHTPPGTEVRVEGRAQNDELLITVADDGPGIPAESLPHVFEKFYRAPTAGTGGTGLGLSLVKGFVEAQGGRVVAANRPGGGATFTIRMPLRKPTDVARASAANYLALAPS
jgi:two-component system, OmpR family, sensor histidine kinase KdpD